MGERDDQEAHGMPDHTVATHEEWLAARTRLLEREKELTRRSDELAEERRALPWVRVDEPYAFDTPDGKKTLAELFDGRSQLLVYHLMYGPADERACMGCTYTGDNFAGAAFHLERHDVSFVAVSRAPLETLEAYRAKTGWTFEWVSARDTGFNEDFWPEYHDLGAGELHGLSAFVIEDGVVYHTYSCFDRGTDVLNGTWQLLDRTPKGRDGGPAEWPLRRYEHVGAGAGAAA
jgi:predicted dithiol-disulfide oxidoreductase (DUF899 family)